MINLCNTNAYSFDENGDQPSKRKPRPTEDIEIMGIIRSDETIDMAAAGGCGLSGIGAITLQFDNNNRTLTIQGNGSILDPNNPRQPDPEELTTLTDINPLRVAHGWYTINPSYSIGSISSNSKLKISNIGLNNNTINASATEVNNAAYANGIINSENLKILNSSYFYGTSIECSGGFISANSKCDSTSWSLDYFELKNSSLADSSVETSYMTTEGAKLIDCNIDAGGVTFDTTVIQSSISQNTANSNGTNTGIIFNDCTVANRSNIVSDYLEIHNTTINGAIQTEILKTETSNTILSSGTVNANFFNGSIINRGKLYISNVTGTSTAYVENIGGFIELNLTGALSLLNTTSGTAVVTQSTTLVLSSNITGIIKGETISFSGSTNQNGGRILCNNTNLYNSQNFGYISNGNFYQDSTNTSVGFVNNGNFYDSTINQTSGIVSVATFYDSSENQSTNIQQPSFLGSSSNRANLTNAIFKDNSNNYSNGVFYEFYNNSKHHQGSLSGAIFYNSGQCISSNQLINTTFYDNSYLDNAAINASGHTVIFYNASSGNNININAGILKLYDNTIINNVNHNSSPNNTGNYVFLYGSSIGKNLNANAILTDSALCENCSKILILKDTSKAIGGSYQKLYAYDNSTVSGFVSQLFLNDSSQFVGDSLGVAVITQDAKLIGLNDSITATSIIFSGGAKNIIGSVSASDTIKFYNQSENANNCDLKSRALFVQSDNYGKVSEIAVFENQSSNNGITDQDAYYIDDSINAGTGSIAFFGSGCGNNGYVNIGYFYRGSYNLGRVGVGYFNENIINTGTVLVSGFKEDNWHILTPPFSSADPAF